MGMSVVTNLAALAANHTLARTSGSLETSQRRLANGQRISRASDDAAGLAISEGLRSQIGGMTQAVRNTQDGISIVQIADGALGETTAILQRMRDLAVHAANQGALNPDAVDAIQKEMAELSHDLDRIATSTNFNGARLLDGRYSGTFQVGANAGETITVAVGRPGRAMDVAGLGLAGIDVTRTLGLASTITRAIPATEGAPQAGTVSLAGDFTTAGVYSTSFTSLEGTISYQGKDFDLGSIDYTGAVTAGDYLGKLNAAAQTALGTSGPPFTAGGSALVFTGDVPGSSSTAQDAVGLTPCYAGPSGASKAVTMLDKAIDLVSSQRADLGAVQNRLEHSVDRLLGAIEDTSASQSRIRDTDMAGEVRELSRSQVLMQAGTAMLAQANQSPQSILKLLAA